MADKTPSVSELVAQKLAEAGGVEALEKTVNVLFEREVNRRADAMVKCIDLLKQEEKNLQKLAPDMKTYDISGKETSAGFSKGRIDERAKVQKKIDKLTHAINKAAANDDFGDVINLSQGKLTDEPAGNTGGGESSGESA